jgi:xanthine dehydrogenase large subunit
MKTKGKYKKESLHLSGYLHVTGKSKFIGDAVKPRDMLIVKSLPSPYAHAKIVSIDLTKAQEFPGVYAVLTYKDIPGQNQTNPFTKDEPLFPEKEVTYVGQPVAVVVAANEKVALAALKLINVKYQELSAILTIEQAHQKKSFYGVSRKIERGDLAKGFKQADHVLEGEVATGAQEHVYLETQRCWAIPGDDEITLYSATQATNEIQEAAAMVLGVANNDITVDVRRLGGAFGGKERTATIWTCLAALAAYHTQKPIEIKLTRLEDQAWTGKRHPFKGKYKIGFNKDGKVVAYEVELSANGGYYLDLTIPILERAMLHAENAYFIPNIKITSYPCKTNLPPNTAFRGFGAPQSVFIIEKAIDRIARFLKQDIVAVREINLYRSEQTTPYEQPVYEAHGAEMFARLKEKSNYAKIVKATDEFNNKNRFVKRGIGVVPVKFGISFTQGMLNQGSSLVWIYTDGSISISHGGIEMGQELYSKVTQIVARELGVSVARIRSESTNTKRIANASPTAASSGCDINGYAALIAARQLKERLAKVAIEMIHKETGFAADIEHLIFADDQIFDSRKKDFKIDFAVLVHHAYVNQVDLGAHGFYHTPGIKLDRETGKGTPFYYFVFGAALVQMEVDVLTGANKMLKAYIVHETAKSINKGIDKGQIAGAFMQGFGMCTMEELEWDAKGRYLAVTPSTYKIPTISDLPPVFDIDLVENDCKHASVAGSKGIGEPPLIYGEAAYFAIKHALESISDKEVDLKIPATPEAIVMAVQA